MTKFTELIAPLPPPPPPLFQTFNTCNTIAYRDIDTVPDVRKDIIA